MASHFTSLDDVLDAVPGFAAARTSSGIVFTATQGPKRVVVWPINEADLSAYVSQLRRGSRGAYRRRRSSGTVVLFDLLQEALLTFEGERGEIAIQDCGLVVQ